jgi:hypothetical protein
VTAANLASALTARTAATRLDARRIRLTATKEPEEMGRWMPPVRRLLTGGLATLFAALVFNVAAASAADLLVLNGDPAVTLSGVQSYGIVYVDGELRLTGDTTINAASIYFGPDARIDTCYVAGAGDGQCAGGRSLALHSSGPLTVATGIDLESGATSGPGGSVDFSGTSVAVGGQIDTSGDTGNGSGSVTISSSGPVAVQAIVAPGAPVSISGHGVILVGNSIQTEGQRASTPGDPLTRMQPGGPVTVNANGGEVDVDGAISAQGQGAPGGGGSGGAGGAVAIAGAGVHAESITTYGGGSQESGSGPGASGAVNITATGALSVGGTIDTSGASGAGGSGAPGAAVTLKASGVVALGAVDASGGPASSGAPITVSGTSVSAGDLNASGGAGSTAARSGADAAPISITAPQGATLGALLAAGGSGDGTQSAPANAGAGSSITVVSSAGSISAGRVESEGGSQGVGPGNSGGPISLKADDDLSVAGDVRADGSNAGGSTSPPWAGGNAGSLYLAAATGTMNLGGNASAKGGSGSGNAASGQLGGAGGAGARITLIAHEIGLLASLSAAGGAGGGYDTEQGPGGPGGSITAYTNATIFSSERWVSTDGGDGNPTGAAGNQTQNSTPADLSENAEGLVSFTTHSPGATLYELETIAKGGAAKVVVKATKSLGLDPHTPVCKTVELAVVAISAGVAWTSDASTPIKYTRPPSKTQSCAAPAKLTLPKKLRTTLKGARRAHWVETLRFHSSGIGTVRVRLTYRTTAGRRGTVTTKLTLRRSGTRVMHLTLPSGVRAAGSGSITLKETSPDGEHHRTRSLKVEVSA